jgi:hypothetical protein
MPKKKVRRARGGVGESRRQQASRRIARPQMPRAADTKPSAEEKRAPNPEPLSKNLRNDKDKNRATYELEGTAKGKRPSRKSTRRSSNRMKPDSNLRRRTTRAVRSPKSRSQMRGA